MSRSHGDHRELRVGVVVVMPVPRAAATVRALCAAVSNPIDPDDEDVSRAARGVVAAADVPTRATVRHVEHGAVAAALLVHRPAVADVGGLGVGATVLRVGGARDGKGGGHLLLAVIAVPARVTLPTCVTQTVSIASADAMGSTHIARTRVVLARVATVAIVAAAAMVLALRYADTVAAAGIGVAAAAVCRDNLELRVVVVVVPSPPLVVCCD